MADRTTFDEAVEPLRAALQAVLDAWDGVRERRGQMPHVDSIAMRELSVEAEYAGGWGRRPIEATHNWAGMLLAGAENQFRTLIRIVVGEPSLFGPQTLARSGIEMAGRSKWFSDPAIGVRRRLARYETERLYNAYEMRRFGDGHDKKSAHISKEITAAAEEMGFELLSGRKFRHTCIEEPRPGGNRIFREVLDEGDLADGVGHTLFSYLSAVDHGTIYGLLESIEAVDPTPAGLRESAWLRMTASNTNQLLAAATLVFIRAAGPFAELFGWRDDAWSSEAHAAARACRRFLELLEEAQADPPLST